MFDEVFSPETIGHVFAKIAKIMSTKCPVSVVAAAAAGGGHGSVSMVTSPHPTNPRFPLQLMLVPSVGP